MTLTSIMRASSSGSHSSRRSRPPVSCPALFITAVISCHASGSVAGIFATAAPSVTSIGQGKKLFPSVSAIDSNVLELRAAPTTFAPRATNIFETEAPIPLEAPVTKIIFSFNSVPIIR